MSLITVGTMAFDAIETPFGKVDKIVAFIIFKIKLWINLERKCLISY